jgi:hypothetical protein
MAGCKGNVKAVRGPTRTPRRRRPDAHWLPHGPKMMTMAPTMQIAAPIASRRRAGPLDRPYLDQRREDVDAAVGGVEVKIMSLNTCFPTSHFCTASTAPFTTDFLHGKPCRNARVYGNIPLEVFRSCWLVTCAFPPTVHEEIFCPQTKQVAARQELFHGVVLSLRSWLAGETQRFAVPAEGQMNGGRPQKHPWRLYGRAAGITRVYPTPSSSSSV